MSGLQEHGPPAGRRGARPETPPRPQADAAEAGGVGGPPRRVRPNPQRPRDLRGRDPARRSSSPRLGAQRHWEDVPDPGRPGGTHGRQPREALEGRVRGRARGRDRSRGRGLGVLPDRKEGLEDGARPIAGGGQPGVRGCPSAAALALGAVRSSRVQPRRLPDGGAEGPGADAARGAAAGDGPGGVALPSRLTHRAAAADPRQAPPARRAGDGASGDPAPAPGSTGTRMPPRRRQIRRAAGSRPSHPRPPRTSTASLRG